MHYDVPKPKKVGINPRLKGLNLDTMFICRNNTYCIGCVVDHVLQRLTKVLCFGVLLLEGMVKHGKTMCGIVHDVTSHMCMWIHHCP